MSATLEYLDRDPLSYQSAASLEDIEDNVTNQLAYTSLTKDLYKYLWKQAQIIEALTVHHLGLTSKDTCTVLAQTSWIQGSFNICIPVEVKSCGISKKVLMRCPMPQKLAETWYPGTVNEKLSCEVGAYAWMHDNCSNIPIPHLFGFGFSDGRHFTHAMHRPFYVRFAWAVRRYLYTFLRYPVPSQYTRNPTLLSLRTGYMLLEFIDPSTGQMLSNTFNKYREDPTRKQNLFRGIAQVILSLARVPQSRIGSFQFHDDGTVTLTNRPLFCETIMLENDGAPRVMQPNNTYTCTEAFVSDILTFHDNRFLNAPNAVFSKADCYGQMATKTILRAVSHHFLNREFRDGPFVLQLTDCHASNLIVDNQWNITCLIDLEWMCSLPVDMLAVPYWLTGQAVDQIAGNLNEFNKVRKEFMHIFEEEEQRIVTRENSISMSKVMHDMWESKGVWFYYSLTSVNAMYTLVEDHICPKFSSQLTTQAERIMSQYWSEDSVNKVAKKLTDKKMYNQEVRRLFKEREPCIGEVGEGVKI